MFAQRLARGLLVVSLASLGLAGLTARSSAADDGSSETTTLVGSESRSDYSDVKITLCHHTHSDHNPYVEVTVAYNAIRNKILGPNGHGTHIGPPTDIIPPFEVGAYSYPGLNWTPETQAILENGCRATPQDEFAYVRPDKHWSFRGYEPPAGLTAEITLTYGSSVAVFTFDAAGDLVSWSGTTLFDGDQWFRVPAEATYTISEKALGDGWVTTGTGTHTAPKANKTKTVDVRNKYEGTEPAKVQVRPTKTWTGDVPASASAVISVYGPPPERELLGTFTFDASGVVTASTGTVGGWLVVDPGEHLTLDETVYLPASYSYDDAGLEGTKVAPREGSEEFPVTNTVTHEQEQQYTLVRPTKTWSGASLDLTAVVRLSASGVGTATFTFPRGGSPSVSGDHVVSSGGHQWFEVPTGTAVTVTEQPFGSLPAYYSVTPSVPSGSVPATGETMVVPITNTVSFNPPYVPPVVPEYARLGVAKVWKGAVPSGAVATVTLTVGGSAYAWSFDAKGTATAAPSPDGTILVSPGASYVVTETTTGIDPAAVTCTTTGLGAGTAPAADQSATVTVTNTCGAVLAEVVTPPVVIAPAPSSMPVTGSPSWPLLFLGLGLVCLGSSLLLSNRKLS